MRVIDADAIEYKESIIDTDYWSTDDVLVWHEKRKLEWVSKEDIDKMPTIEAEPVRHGKWEDCSNGWMCSVCCKDVSKDYNYCPHCGAKMDLDEVNE